MRESEATGIHGRLLVPGARGLPAEHFAQLRGTVQTHVEGAEGQTAQGQPGEVGGLPGTQIGDQIETVIPDVAEKSRCFLRVHGDPQVVAEDGPQNFGLITILDDHNQAPGEIHALQNPGGHLAGAATQAQEHAPWPRCGQDPGHFAKGRGHDRRAAPGREGLAKTRISLRRLQIEFPAHVVWSAAISGAL